MKKNAEAGIDGINFELELVGADKGIYMDERTRVNPFGTKYSTSEIKKGILYVYLNPSLAIRENNICPFMISDMDHIPMIKSDLLDDLQSFLESEGIKCDVRKSLLKQIECGITKRVTGESTCSQIINLLNRSFDKTKVYQRYSSECPQLKDNDYFETSRKNYYDIKGYDKSLDEWRKGNINVVDKLLRIEIRFHQRAIQKIFGEKSTLDYILQEKSLLKVIAEYKRLFSDEIIEGHIKPCLTSATNKFFESLTQTDSAVETLARYRELVVDDEVVRRALKKWYAFRGMPDYSRQIMQDLKKFGLPKDVIRTIKEFHDSCGR